MSKRSKTATAANPVNVAEGELTVLSIKDNGLVVGQTDGFLIHYMPGNRGIYLVPTGKKRKCPKDVVVSCFEGAVSTESQEGSLPWKELTKKSWILMKDDREVNVENLWTIESLLTDRKDDVTSVYGRALNAKGQLLSKICQAGSDSSGRQLQDIARLIETK